MLATKVSGIPSIPRQDKLPHGTLPVSLRGYVVTAKGTFRLPPFVRFQPYDNVVILTLPQLVNDADIEIKSLHVVNVESNVVVRAYQPEGDATIPANMPYVLAMTVPIYEHPPARVKSEQKKAIRTLKRNGGQKSGHKAPKKLAKIVKTPVAGRKTLPVKRAV